MSVERTGQRVAASSGLKIRLCEYSSKCPVSAGTQASQADSSGAAGALENDNTKMRRVSAPNVTTSRHHKTHQ